MKKGEKWVKGRGWEGKGGGKGGGRGEVEENSARIKIEVEGEGWRGRGGGGGGRGGDIDRSGGEEGGEE